MTLSSREIRAVYAARGVVHGRYMALHVRQADATGRAAVVAGRRVGSAVDRNRAKRRLRALLRDHGAPEGTDAVLVAKPGADRVPFAVLSEDYQRLTDRALREVRRGARGAGGPGDQDGRHAGHQRLAGRVHLGDHGGGSGSA